MKKNSLALMLLTVMVTPVWAQQGVSVSPDYSSILDLRNPSNKGLLIPQVALTNITLKAPVPADPATSTIKDGMLVYNTSTSTANGLSGKGYYYWDNTAAGWVFLLSAAPWNVENTTNLAISNTSNIYQKGTVGIGVGTGAVNNKAALWVYGTEADASSSVLFGQDISGAGSRLYWNPAKYAFRAGYVGGTQWNDANIGNYSVAMGQNTIASGDNSFSVGLSNTVSASRGVALGSSNNVQSGGIVGIALGNQNTVSGAVGVAAGFNNTAGQNSVAMGNGNIAYDATLLNQTAIALGQANINYGFLGSTAIGYQNKINNVSRLTSTNAGYEIAIGYNNATDAPYAIAIGSNNNSNAQASMTLGSYVNATNPGALVMGDGNNTVVSSTVNNQFTSSFSGGYRWFIDRAMANGVLLNATAFTPVGTNMDLGVNVPGSSWRNIYSQFAPLIASDIRLKQNIQPLTYGLKEILQIDPISYSLKADKDNKIQLGVSAQQMQKILPEIVNVGTDEAKSLSVGYTEIIPVLINAIKEQQKEIDALKKKMATLQK